MAVADELTGRPLARAAAILLPTLPAWLDPAIGAVAGTLAWLLAPAARRAVAANLAVAVPERRDRDSLVRLTFVWQARHYLELFRLARMDVAALNDAIEVIGWDHFVEALGRGRGVVLTSGHVGSVSACGQIVVARGVAVTLPVETATSAFAREVNRARGAVGLKLVPTSAALGMHRILKKGGVLGIIADRAVTGVGVRVQYFGRDALLPSAAVVLALRTGAALVPAFAERERGKLVSRFEPELVLARSGDHDADVRDGVRRFGERLAEAVRRHPEEWSVFEPIWDEAA